MYKSFWKAHGCHTSSGLPLNTSTSSLLSRKVSSSAQAEISYCCHETNYTNDIHVWTPHYPRTFTWRTSLTILPRYVVLVSRSPLGSGHWKWCGYSKPLLGTTSRCNTFVSLSGRDDDIKALIVEIHRHLYLAVQNENTGSTMPTHILQR